MWNEIVTFYERYVGTGMLAALFLVSIIYLFLTEKNKTTRIMFIYVPGILLLIFFCPLFAKIVCGFTGGEIYWRILWLVPIVPVLAYTAVKIVMSVTGMKKIVAGVSMALILMISGNLVYKNADFVKAENVYHIPQVVVDLCEAIKEEEIVRAAFPVEHIHYVRQYTQDIYMPFGREMIIEEWGGQDRLYDLTTAPVLDVAAIAEELRNRDTEYIVFHRDRQLLGRFEDYQFEFIYETDGYVVYRDSLYGR